MPFDAGVDQGSKTRTLHPMLAALHRPFSQPIILEISTIRPGALEFCVRID